MRPAFIPPSATLALIEAEMFNRRKPEPQLDLSNVNLLGTGPGGGVDAEQPKATSNPNAHTAAAAQTITSEIARLSKRGKELEAQIARDQTELANVRKAYAAFQAAAAQLNQEEVRPQPPKPAAPTDQVERPSVAEKRNPPAPVR